MRISGCLANTLTSPWSLSLGVYAAGGVGRRTEQQHAGVLGDCSLKLRRGDFEILLNGSGHAHGGATGELHHFDIADPGRSGDDHLVAGINRCQNHVAEPLA